LIFKDSYIFILVKNSQLSDDRLINFVSTPRAGILNCTFALSKKEGSK
jgi:hypothetical protein